MTRGYDGVDEVGHYLAMLAVELLKVAEAFKKGDVVDGRFYAARRILASEKRSDADDLRAPVGWMQAAAT